MRLSFRTKLIIYILLIATAVFAFFPVYWMLTSSFKSEREIITAPPVWFTQNPTLKNYLDLFTQFNFGILTRNSLLITLGVVLISLVVGGLAAYGFSRYPFRGSKWFLAALLITRMITPSSLVVPLFTLMDKLGRLNHLDSIIAGITVLNLPFVIWMLKPFFDSLPKEIEEAAEMDGLTPFGVFWKITIPLAAPAIFTVSLFSFITGWVDLLFGMSFSTVTEAMPLTVGLLQMQTGYKIYWGALMAGGIYLTLPTFVIALLFQKYLLKGLRTGY